MGSHFKEKLYDPKTRPLGMFVKFPTLETTEILASSGLDFIILDMEHAPLGVETVYGMIAVAERCGMSALVRLRGHDISTGNMFLDAGASGVLVAGPVSRTELGSANTTASATGSRSKCISSPFASATVSNSKE